VDKVKLTQQQADVLETELKSSQINGDKSKFVKMYVNLGDDDWQDGYPLTCLKNDDLIRALYIGYEVEQTPEERLVELFKQACKEEECHDYRRPQQQWWEGRRMGMIDTLNTLNIKIKGVNE
jgi:hypothetical protein